TQTGLLGAGTFIALLIAWCLQAWQLWRNQHLAPAARQWGLYFLAFMASYVINGMFHDTSPIPNLNMLLLFFGAITSSLAAMATMPHSVPAIAPAETRSEEQPELAAAGA